MKDPSGTNQKLLEEISVLKQRIEELEHSETNIADRKQIGEMLKESEIKFRDLSENPLAGIFLMQQDGILRYVNSRCAEIFGYKVEEIINKLNVDEVVFPGDRPIVRESLHKRISGKLSSHHYEFRIVAKNKDIKYAEVYSSSTVYKGKPAIIAILLDITKRKKAEEELRKSKQYFDNLVSNIPVGVYLLHTTPAGGFTFEYVSPRMAKILAVSTENILTNPEMAFQPIHLEDIEAFRKLNQERFEDRQPFAWEGRAIVTGTVKWLRIESYPEPLDNGDVLWHGIVADITERKRMEEALKENEEGYRKLFENANEAILVVQGDKLVLLNTMTATVIGYSHEELMARPFVEFIHLDDRNIVMDRYIRRMKGEEIPHLYSFRVIHRDGTIRWVELNAVLISWKGKPATLNFLSDITERRQTEKSLHQTMEKLRKNLVGTIQAMSLMVETRDPYTAGHQKRVSNLARVIAQEMGLPNDTVDIIRMAGVIHDLGKIAVPAEILSKSTKLTDIEFKLIKVHPQAGYDILKDVDLPYPIAEMVLQHHERLDGLGYPQGLKDTQILPEARILAVADVVEAMASHRPYRPAKGIDTALEEIEKNKGIFYDTKVVDACMRVFREKGFTFETAAS